MLQKFFKWGSRKKILKTPNQVIELNNPVSNSDRSLQSKNFKENVLAVNDIKESIEKNSKTEIETFNSNPDSNYDMSEFFTGIDKLMEKYPTIYQKTFDELKQKYRDFKSQLTGENIVQALVGAANAF